MTIGEVIEIVNSLYPSAYDRSQMIRWLSILDGSIHRDLILQCEHDEADEAFDGYTDDTSDDTELLAPYPYDHDLYTRYLQARIDIDNAELSRYQVSGPLYNAAYESFAAYWRRNHRPLPKNTHFLF